MLLLLLLIILTLLNNARLGDGLSLLNLARHFTGHLDDLLTTVGLLFLDQNFIDIKLEKETLKNWKNYLESRS